MKLSVRILLIALCALMCLGALTGCGGAKDWAYIEEKGEMVIGITLFFTAMLAKSLGCILPILAKTLKLDPAYMASPMITALTGESQTCGSRLSSPW